MGTPDETDIDDQRRNYYFTKGPLLDTDAHGYDCQVQEADVTCSPVLRQWLVQYNA